METFVMPCLPASPGSVPADGISPGRAEEGEMFLELFSAKGLGNMEQTGQEEKAAEEEAENEEPAMPAVLPATCNYSRRQPARCRKHSAPARKIFARQI